VPGGVECRRVGEGDAAALAEPFARMAFDPAMRHVAGGTENPLGARRAGRYVGMDGRTRLDRFQARCQWEKRFPSSGAPPRASKCTAIPLIDKTGYLWRGELAAK